ncbi:MAG: imidazolonepropionase [Bacteroidota bacterium]
MKKLIGPFKELLTLDGIALRGAVPDEKLEIIQEAGILLEKGTIKEIGVFERMRISSGDPLVVQQLEEEVVGLPGFIDAHTHICFGGSRARDYAMRVAGKSYLEIARSGGGIWDSVSQTRKASLEELKEGIKERAKKQLEQGITTVEVKSGYGLNQETEIRMLQAIREAGSEIALDLIPTCLAAHIHPKDFEGDKVTYLNYILNEILPQIRKQSLANRVDIFIEDTAFEEEMSARFLRQAKSMSFDLTVHADQFTPGGTKVAVETGALSADHLEASREKEIALLAQSNTIPVVLPGASLGLGEPFGPARKLLDAGASLAIASDWNPGSAPMGQLLTQAAILGTYEKLSTAETLAALTFRAAAALGLKERGVLREGMLADIVAFPAKDHREILYHQGSLKPVKVWKRGKAVV